MTKIYTGTYQRPKDWKPGKDGQPSEHAKVVVAAMFEKLAKAKAKELHIVSQKEQGDIFQKCDEFGYGPVFPSAFLWM
jgi:hypothetical protein